MKFIIDMAVSTFDKSMYYIGGRLVDDNKGMGVSDFRSAIIDTLGNLAVDSGKILFNDDCIKFACIPVIDMAEAIKLWNRVPEISISVTMADDATVVPIDKKPLLRMELGRWFPKEVV